MRILRGGFRGVSEVSRNHSRYSLDDGCAPFQLQSFTRYTHSRLNSGVTGFCFDSKLRKCSEDLFFGQHEGKLETYAKICVAASLETLREDPTVCALQKSATNRLFGNYSAKSLEPPLRILQ